jgi:hypothetical protein
MSTHAGPNIVEDGLVLSIDPANQKSLPLQNLLLQSEKLADSPWLQITGTGGVITRTNNSLQSPDGSNTATLINVSTFASGSSIYQDIDSPGTASYVVSVYMKPGTMTGNITLGVFYLTGGTTQGFNAVFNPQTGSFVSTTGISGISENVGGGWFKLSLSVIGTNALNTKLRFQIYASSSGTIYYWGAQIRRPYAPSTYIKTESSTIDFGNIINDISNNGNNGTLVNSPTFSLLNQGSINVDGVDDYIVCGRVPHTGTSTSSVSWEIWVCPQSTSGNIMSMSSVNPQGSWNMPPITASSQRFTGKIWSNTRLQDTSTYNLNQWYQVVLIWDYSNTTQKLYVNGIQKAFQSGITYSASGLNNFLFFGQQNPGADNAGMFQGKYGQINVYGNKALTDTEVKQNFNALRGRYGI